jgi:hypothetical protein
MHRIERIYPCGVTSSPARRLILLYVALHALLLLYALFAADLSLPSDGSVLFWAGLSALLVWRLWHGSAGAWLICLLLDLLGVAGIVLMSLSFGLTPVLFIAFASARLTILLSSPVRAHVWSPPDPRVATG